MYSSIPWTDDRLLLVGKKKIALYAKSGEQVAENSVENISGGEIQTIYHNGCDRFSPESGGFRPVVEPRGRVGDPDRRRMAGRARR